MGYLSINNINKSFKTIHALNNVSLEIEKGEFVTLLGPSGCGKSTLLRIIAGLEIQNSGDILISGKSIADVPVNKRNMGMVFQSYSLFPNMTAEENIAFGLKLKKLSKEDIASEVKKIIGIVGLGGREKSYPHQLSGGQQQRVALARALIVNPDVLLLDEPLSALDAKIRISLRSLIKEIQQKLKITTVFVTHDQEEALSLSDRIFVMEKGNIVQQGTPMEIYSHPSCSFVASFIGTYNFLNPDLVNSDTSHNLAIRPESIDIVAENNKCSEDVFSGTIKNIYFMGNIIRLNISVNDKIIVVDRLNNSSEAFKEGQDVLLKLPKEKFLEVC